jgi:hypothetical protein
MSSHFWWNWIVQALIAFGTIGAVFVALFGDWLRSKIAPPKLVLSLKNTVGEYSPYLLVDQAGHPQQIDSRWYHVRVENERPWSRANFVQTFLVRLEEPDASGAYQSVWLGELPIRWRRQELKPLTATIGYHGDDGDLCAVRRDGHLELLPLLRPYTPKTEWPGSHRMIVTLQARSIECASNLLRVEISWDGQWQDDEIAMSRHMVVKAT